MQGKTLSALASRGNAALEVEVLELGPDVAGAWEDVWQDGDGELVADSPGWWRAA